MSGANLLNAKPPQSTHLFNPFHPLNVDEICVPVPIVNTRNVHESSEPLAIGNWFICYLIEGAASLTLGQ